jgi:hypothetical protein
MEKIVVGLVSLPVFVMQDLHALAVLHRQMADLQASQKSRPSGPRQHSSTTAVFDPTAISEAFCQHARKITGSLRGYSPQCRSHQRDPLLHGSYNFVLAPTKEGSRGSSNRAVHTLASIIVHDRRFCHLWLCLHCTGHSAFCHPLRLPQCLLACPQPHPVPRSTDRRTASPPET